MMVEERCFAPLSSTLAEILLPAWSRLIDLELVCDNGDEDQQFLVPWPRPSSELPDAAPSIRSAAAAQPQAVCFGRRESRPKGRSRADETDAARSADVSDGRRAASRHQSYMPTALRQPALPRAERAADQRDPVLRRLLRCGQVQPIGARLCRGCAVLYMH